MTAGPFNQAVERFNAAWNQLHADVCGRGLVPANDQLCRRVVRARDEWSEFYHSAGAAVVPWYGWERWMPRYQALREEALSYKLRVKAPEYVPTPVEQTTENVKQTAQAAARAAARAANLTGRFFAGVAAIAILSWAVGQSTGRRR